MHVEDHPLDYGGFEGTIPKGEYGGGTVMLWDRGTWEPLGDPHEGLKKGTLQFRLHGERLKGGWALVRMPPRGKEKRENWLLIKERDEDADEADPLLDEIHDERRDRPHDGGDRQGQFRRLALQPRRPRQRRSRARARGARRRRTLPLPKFRPPQLATLVDDAAGRRRLGARVEI